MTTLRFARELAEFEHGLDWMEGNGDLDYPLAALAVSYRSLLADLIDLDEHLSSAPLAANTPRIPDILARAIRVFTESMAQGSSDEQKRHQAGQAQYAEIRRRHELAVTVECPYCGVMPGQNCHTAGPSGSGYPKGIYDHKDRYRAATDPHWKKHAEARASVQAIASRRTHEEVVD